jgi:hypothetical protein
MISENVNNCIGIPVKVTSQDTEEEIEKIPGILSFFNIKFRKMKHTFQMRKRECFCQYCWIDDYNNCTNKSITGKMENFKTKVLGIRQPTGRETVKNGPDEATEEDEYVVEKVVGRRIHRVN